MELISKTFSLIFCISLRTVSSFVNPSSQLTLSCIILLFLIIYSLKHFKSVMLKALPKTLFELHKFPCFNFNIIYNLYACFNFVFILICIFLLEIIPLFCAITSKRLFFTQYLHTTQVVCYARCSYCHLFLY